MELYNFLRGSMAWTVTVALLWPLNVPLMALAYKVRNGQGPITMKRHEFWARSTFAALALALLTLAMVLLDYTLAYNVGFPAGPVHMVMFMAYVPTAVWILFVFFAFDDLLQGLSVFVIFVCLPVLVLFLVNAVFGWWEPLLNWAKGWLMQPA